MMLARKLQLPTFLPRLILAAVLFTGWAHGAAPARATSAQPAPAAPGALDPAFGGFGDEGEVQIDNFGVVATTVAPDGKIVAVGGGLHVDSEVRRFLADGRPDPSFGDEGVVELHPPLGMETIRIEAVAVQPDGRIVVVGRNTNTDYSGGANFLVMRLTIFGDPDSSFGQSGLVLTDFENKADIAKKVLIQPNGKILVAGSARIGPDFEDFAVARYHSNGHLDDATDGDGGFGGDGRVTVAFENAEYANDLALQPDGRIVVVGTAIIGNDYDFAVARLESDGSLDDNSDGDGGFSGDGKVTTGFGDDEEALAVALQPDGKIVVVGQDTFNADFNGFVARYTTTGGLDGSFDGDGKYKQANERLLAVVTHADGKWLVGGYYFGADNQRVFTVRRWTAAGVPDTSFNGGAGVLALPYSGAPDTLNLTLQPDSRVLLSLITYSFSRMLRVWPDGVTPDTAGQQVYGAAFPPYYQPGYQESVTALALRPDGAFYVAGYAYSPDNSFSDATVTRFSAEGLADRSFGLSGNGTVRAFSGLFNVAKGVAVQSDGKVVMAGYTSYDAQYTLVDFMITRYTANGLPDTNFGFQGMQTVDFADGADFGIGLALAPEGKIVVAGGVWNSSANDWGVVRLTAAGQPDPTFGGGDGEAFVGLGLSNGLNAVAVQPDGKILLAGIIAGDLGLVRLTEAGELDSDFGSGGVKTTDLGGVEFINALALASDGLIYGAGTRILNNKADIVLAQYTPAGELAHCDDPADCHTWPTGVTVVDTGSNDYGYALDLRADHQLAVAGCTAEHFAGFQLLTDGEATQLLPFNTNFNGYPDCAKAVRFQGTSKVLMAGDQSLYPFHTDANIALARFEAGTYVAPAAAYQLLLPLVLR